MKIEKIIGLGFFIATLSLVGLQIFTYFAPRTYVGWAKSVYVEDDIAYIADNNYGLVIMDVSAPLEPYELGRLSQVSSWGSGTQIYVRDQIAYLLGDEKLKLIDISNPSSPIQSSVFGANIDGMYVDFPFFYLFNHPGAFRIYNFSDPLTPSQLSYIDLGASIYGVYVRDNIAYITHADGLKIMDVSNSSNPIELGQFYTDDNYLFDCVVDGNIAYVTGWPGYIDIIDVTVPTDPTKLSQFNEGGGSSIDFGTAFLDDTLYVCDLNDGLELIDVSNPLKPFKYAQFDLRSPADVFIIYPYAYLACLDDGLKIVDISNPSLWNFIPSILNFAITIVSIGVIVSLILLKLRIQKKNM